MLANRLKNYLDLVVHRDLSYCVQDRSMIENLFLKRDLFDICKMYNIDVGVISLDQAFDREDHNFLFFTLRTFDFRNIF